MIYWTEIIRAGLRCRMAEFCSVAEADNLHRVYRTEYDGKRMQCDLPAIKRQAVPEEFILQRCANSAPAAPKQMLQYFDTRDGPVSDDSSCVNVA